MIKRSELGRKIHFLSSFFFVIVERYSSVGWSFKLHAFAIEGKMKNRWCWKVYSSQWKKKKNRSKHFERISQQSASRFEFFFFFSHQIEWKIVFRGKYIFILISKCRSNGDGWHSVECVWAKITSGISWCDFKLIFDCCAASLMRHDEALRKFDDKKKIE